MMPTSLQDVEDMQKAMEAMSKIAPLLKVIFDYLPPIEVRAIVLRDPETNEKREYLAILLPPKKEEKKNEQ